MTVSVPEKFSEDLYDTADSQKTKAPVRHVARSIPTFDPHSVLGKKVLNMHTPNELPDADLPLFTPKHGEMTTSASALIDRCRQYMVDSDIRKIREAYRYADQAHLGQFRKSGEPYITHPIAVATILASWKLDATTIEAGLMHDVLEDTPHSKQEMAERFGVAVAEVVDGVSKLDKLHFASNEIAQAESFRKMLLAMSRDLRVILVKLADRLHNMRTLGVMRPEKRARIAKETLDIYVPIAHRLGLNNVFRELQELSFANRYPLRYKVLYHNILQCRQNRRNILERILSETKEALPKFGIQARIIGRDKTIYGIYNKMRDKHQSFSEALDIYGFRIIVPTKEDCYRTLGALHALYKPVNHRFKDFIAIPKLNGYQGLHTTVIGPNGTPIEYQIRSEAMHRTNEEGILTHWLYKDQACSIDMHSRTASWLQNLLDIQRTSTDSTEFFDNIKIDLFPNRLYVFTPKGKIISLPKGSTVIDFAYQIHTDVGNHAQSARINGEDRPLQTSLKNGDMVEVTTDANAKPSPMWLDYVHSGRARAEIRQFLRNCQINDAQAIGQKAFREEAHAAACDLKQISRQQWALFLSEEMKLTSREELFANIGLGKDLASTTLHRLVSFLKDHAEFHPRAYKPEQALPPVMIKGNQGVAVQLASCCHPIPGDRIDSFARPGHGLMVHRHNCPHAIRGQKVDPDRWFPAQWTQPRHGTLFPVPLDVSVNNPRAALAQIITSVAQANSSITGISMPDDEEKATIVRITVQVRDTGHLMHVTRTINQLPIVSKVKRAFEAGLAPSQKNNA